MPEPGADGGRRGEGGTAGRRLLWFVALWGAGVAVVGLVSLLIRMWLIG